MTEEKTELKGNVSEMEGDLLYKNTQMKVMSLHLDLIEERGRKLAAGNENLRVTNREIIALSMNRFAAEKIWKSYQDDSGKPGRATCWYRTSNRIQI